jgi:hypothetical protein
MSEQDVDFDASAVTDEPDHVDPDVVDPALAPASQLYDVDGDGRMDVLLTRFGDGAWTTVSDEDSDGAAETFLADVDGDGVPDLAVERLPDGSYLVRADSDGDGTYDLERTVDRTTLADTFPGVVGYLDAHFDPAAPVDTDVVVDPADGTPGGDVVVDGRLIGDPVGDGEHWFEQARNGYCAPASIAQIVSEYTGRHYTDESAFVDLANRDGLFTISPDGVPGMTPENALTLLESSGVPAELQVGTVGDLAQYLDEGRRVLLFVDSGEIWHGEAVEDNTMDHAVVLTGIDVERGVAILSDPGTPDGNQEEVPLDVFEDAWADSHHTMLVCDEPPADDQLGPDQLGPDQADPQAASHDATQIESASAWLTQRPWALLPVTLPADLATAAR